MKKTIFHILPMALLASCTSELADMNVNNVTEGNVDKVTIKSKAFVYGDDTRTSLTATDNGISFAWASYDALGVFPITPESNNQAKQSLKLNTGNCENDAHYASFDGAGWGLKKENTYAAYTPYNGDIPASTSYTEVPIDMTGQNGTLATIGRSYDYMYAPATFTEESCANGKTHEVVFDFNHVIAIVQLKLTMPVAATWKSITLANKKGEKVWVTSATMNVSTGFVSSKVTSSSVSLALSNMTTTENNKELVAYLAALPTKTEELQLTITSVDGKEYVTTLGSKTLLAGKAYRYTVNDFVFTATGTKDGHAYVDLGLDSKLLWATMNVGATSPTDFGHYYAWGETTEQNDGQYSSNSYSLYENNGYTKYNTNDGVTTLVDKDDAATVNMGGGWRTPTIEELSKIKTDCYWVWTDSYNGTGVAGFIVYPAKSSEDKGKIVSEADVLSNSYSLSDVHIFLPAAGFRYEGELKLTNDKDNNKKIGIYWSSSLVSTFVYNAHCLRFYKGYCDVAWHTTRAQGFTIRAVCQ